MENQETKLCKHCQTEIPKKAKVCPNCRKKQGGKLKWIIIAVLVIIVIGAIAGGGGDDADTKEGSNKETEVTSNDVSSSKDEQNNNKDTSKEKATEQPEVKATKEPKVKKESKSDYIDSCGEYDYKKVLRKPKKYVGKRIKVQLKISSVHEASWLNDTKYYFAYSESDYGWYGDHYAIFDKRDKQKPKLLEDDIIEVYGEIAEPETTKSLIVASSEVFAIDMKYVKLLGE